MGAVAEALPRARCREVGGSARRGRLAGEEYLRHCGGDGVDPLGAWLSEDPSEPVDTPVMMLNRLSLGGGELARRRLQEEGRVATEAGIGT